MAETEHVCRLLDPWPTGHPIPPEDPAKLTGPEVGTFMVYRSKGVRIGRFDPDKGEMSYTTEGTEPRIVRVIARSYVWSPGECRAKGGYRHYDWSVIEEGPNRYRAVVVDDVDLSPIPDGQRVVTAYAIRR